uniref:Uncharacterized protein n=1 Tax=Anguilla anguilla TaxID=7936 RepID=A0A0E9R6J3_ANGAN
MRVLCNASSHSNKLFRLIYLDLTFQEVLNISEF